VLALLTERLYRRLLSAPQSAALVRHVAARKPPVGNGPSFWKGWPNHFWFGQGLFVDKGDVIVFSEFFVDSAAAPAKHTRQRVGIRFQTPRPRCLGG